MVNNPFLLPIAVSIHIPISLAFVFSLAFIGAATGIWLSGLPLQLQIIFSVLLIIYCLYLYYIWYAQLPRKLILMPDDSWRIIDHDNRVYLARLSGTQYVHCSLLLLQLYWGHRCHFIPIIATLPIQKTSVRRLRVRITHALYSKKQKIP